jgi:hypothetical protein
MVIRFEPPLIVLEAGTASDFGWFIGGITL